MMSLQCKEVDTRRHSVKAVATVPQINGGWPKLG